MNILREQCNTIWKTAIGENFILQQDNNPKHTARIVKYHLNEIAGENVAETMVWPPQNPDLNIIEQMRDYLEKAKNKKSPENVNE